MTKQEALDILALHDFRFLGTDIRKEYPRDPRPAKLLYLFEKLMPFGWEKRQVPADSLIPLAHQYFCYN